MKEIPKKFTGAVECVEVLICPKDFLKQE